MPEIADDIEPVIETTAPPPVDEIDWGAAEAVEEPGSSADDDFAGAPENGVHLAGDGSATSRLEEGDGTLPETGDDSDDEATPAAATDLDESGEPVIAPPALSPDVRVVVLFDENAHAFREGLVLVDDVMPFVRTNRPIVYGVRNPTTGERELHPYGGDVKPAFEAAWAAVNGEAPPVPPDDIVAALAAAHEPAPETWHEAPAPEPEPVLEPLTPERHAEIANAHWGALYGTGHAPAFDIAATAQGIAIAGDAARERRQHFPASIPEASVAAVEALGGTLRGLRHLLACYRHLAHAAAGGVDVSEAIEAVDSVAAPLLPTL